MTIAAARNGVGVAGVAPGREGLRHQGDRPGQRPLLPGERRLRLRVRRRPRRRDHQQQLLRRPVAVQLHGRPRPAGHRRRGQPGPAVRHEEGHPAPRLGGQLQPRPGLRRDRRRHQPRTTRPRSRGPSTRTSASTCRPSCRASSRSARPACKNAQVVLLHVRQGRHRHRGPGRRPTATRSRTRPSKNGRILSTHAGRRVRLPAGHVDGGAARRGCRRAAQVQAPVGHSGASSRRC